MIDTTIPTPTSGCTRCESVPEPLPASGTLYLAPPIIQTSAQIRGYLDSLRFSYQEVHPGIFAVPFTRDMLNALCSDHLCKVSRLELKDTKCLVLPEGEPLAIHHLTRMQPLESVVARIEGEWLLDILGNERVHSVFQPIVSAGNPDEVFAYECLARGTDSAGEPINPKRMFDIAGAADLLFNLDRACRLAAIRGCHEHNLQETIFVNFNPTTIYNPNYCLRTTMQAINQAGLKPADVVFEVVETEEVTDVDHLLSILDYYRDHGFRVALDDLGAGFSSLNLLTRLRPDFVKLDMGLVRNVDTDDYKAIITENLVNMAHSLGVRVIAEGVETVGEWKWLVNCGADYLQGFLFATPAAPPKQPVIPTGN